MSHFGKTAKNSLTPETCQGVTNTRRVRDKKVGNQWLNLQLSCFFKIVLCSYHYSSQINLVKRVKSKISPSET